MKKNKTRRNEMKTLKETRIEMETVEDIFSCPVDPTGSHFG